jgi:lysophospholipase L1-like esterase
VLLIAANGCVAQKMADPGTAATPAASTNRMAPTGPVPPSNRIAPTAAVPPFDFSRVAFVGRVAFAPSGQAQYAWSGAGFALRFRGRGLALDMNDPGNHHTVVLDGTLRPKLVTQRDQHKYTIVDNLEAGEHQVELYRRTEALFGVTTLISIEVIDGELLAPKDSPRRHIEVVGDSITCGYGDEGSDATCRFSAETENHYLTYGARLARHFGATLSTVAWSGRGVVKNYDGESADLMPVLYKRTLPEQPETRQNRRAPADLVIINLGTNDFSTEPDPAEATFVEAYFELLAEVRRQSPNAYVLTTIGPMLGAQDLERAERGILEAVKRRTLAGDQRVGYHKMRTTNDKPGCDWHPSIRTHELMEQELVEPVARALGW